MMQQGSHMLVQNHAQRKPDFRRGKKLGAKDHLIEWKKLKRKPGWITQSDYDALPNKILFREFSVKGCAYVTTLMNAKKYHKKELAQLYTQLWLVELDFRSLKTQMQMDLLRCKSPDMVNKEIAVCLLAYNLIRASIARAAKVKAQVPRQISFMTTVQIFNEGILQLIVLSEKILKYAIDGLLSEIASIPIGQQNKTKQNKTKQNKTKQNRKEKPSHVP